MNKKQKNFLIKFVLVIAITVIMVIGVSNFKEYVNRSETLRAMTDLNQRIIEYRKLNGTLPSEDFINTIRSDLMGSARVGNIEYRGKYIDYLSGPSSVLAYSKKEFSGFLIPDGYVVLRLNGQVQWLTADEFKTEMALQWKPGEQENRSK